MSRRFVSSIVAPSLRMAVLAAAVTSTMPDLTRAGAPVEYSWVGDSVDSTSWFDPSNWDVNFVPSASSIAQVSNVGHAPVLTSNATVGTLSLHNVQISSSGSQKVLTIDDQLNITGAGSTSLFDVHIRNNGQAYWNSGNIFTNFAPRITNNGTFSVQCDEQVIPFFYPKAVITNNGLFRKSSGTATSMIAADLSNHGTVQAEVGTLSFTSDNAPINTGTFGAFSGATLRLSGLRFENGSNFGGAGAMELVSSNHVSETTTVRSGNLSVIGVSNVISGAIVTDAGATFELANGGDLTGTGSIGGDGEFHFTGGRMYGDFSPGAGSLVNSGTMRITGGNTKTFWEGRFTNAGNAIWDNGDIETDFSPTINNTGVMDLQSNNVIYAFFHPVANINNSGTWKKTAGGGLSSLNINLNNTGTVIADSGEMRFTGVSSVSNGTFISNGSAIVSLSNQSFQTGTNFRGSGVNHWSSSNTAVGSINIASGQTRVVGPGNAITGTVSISAGAIFDLANGGDLTGTGSIGGDGEFHFTGGRMYGDFSPGAGSLVNSGTMRITGGNTKTFWEGRFTNAGNAIWDNGDIETDFSPTINNTGVMDLQSNNVIYAFFHPVANINNSGTWKKTAGGGLSSLNINLNNTGTVIADSGEMRFTGVSSVSNGTFISNGSAIVSLSNQSFQTGTNFRGSGVNHWSSSNTAVGSINIASGQTRIVGPGNAITGTVSISAGAIFDLANGGDLTGTGSIGGDGEFHFTGGRMYGDFSPGAGSLVNSGTMRITGGNTKTFWEGRFTNAGNAIWDNGDIETDFSPTINNTGVMDLQFNNVIYAFFHPVANINNSGTWKKTAGAGISQINAKFDSSGTFLAASGSMNFVQDFTSTGNLTVNPGAFVELNGPVTTLGGVQNWPDGYALTLPAIANLNSDAGYAGPKLHLTKSGGGTLTMTTTQHLQSLTVNGSNAVLTTGGDKVLSTGSLTLSNAPILDLTDNDMIIDYTTTSQLAFVESSVANARNFGAWDQPGITSTSARDHVTQATTLGVMEAADYIAIQGDNFSGETVDDTAVLVKYTWYGDTDFNGGVDFDDYVRIDTGFNTGLGGWVNGDLDFSGGIDFDDYVLIDNAFNSQNGTLIDAMNWLEGEDRSLTNASLPGVKKVVEHYNQFGMDFANAFYASVPEPSAVGVLGAAMLGASRRRRRVN